MSHRSGLTVDRVGQGKVVGSDVGVLEDVR